MIFIQTNTVTTRGGSVINAAFPSSLYTQVFPCSRRRSVGIGTGSEKNQRSFPFDPEARLNTERNNRRGTGINGYTDSFLTKVDINHVQPDGSTSDLYYPEGTVELTIAGYSFKLLFDRNLVRSIKEEIPKLYKNEISNGIDFLGKAIAKQNLQDADADKIYANIIMESVNLYDGSTEGMEYDSWVLRHQVGIGDVSTNTAMDVLRDTEHTKDESISQTQTSNYFFSGLSFTTRPLTDDTSKVVSECEVSDNDTKQILVSLCILEKQGNSWAINQEALLPNIRHGERVDSLEVGYLNSTGLTQNNIPVASIQVESCTCGCGKYRLRFTTSDTCSSTYTCAASTPAAE